MNQTLVSVVIPTRNEESNIAMLLSKLNFASNQFHFEAIVVDDSEDSTAVTAARLGARVVKGQGKGLGQAIIDGIENSKGEVILVMDADGQHPVTSIPAMLKPILEEGVDMTIGSRYCKGGKYADPNTLRKINTKMGSLLGQALTGLSDATSGFFAFRRSILCEGK